MSTETKIETTETKTETTGRMLGKAEAHSQYLLTKMRKQNKVAEAAAGTPEYVALKVEAVLLGVKYEEAKAKEIELSLRHEEKMEKLKQVLNSKKRR